MVQIVNYFYVVCRYEVVILLDVISSSFDIYTF
jgi:hypothetical protein